MTQNHVFLKAINFHSFIPHQILMASASKKITMYKCYVLTTSPNVLFQGLVPSSALYKYNGQRSLHFRANRLSSLLGSLVMPNRPGSLLGSLDHLHFHVHVFKSLSLSTFMQRNTNKLSTSILKLRGAQYIHCIPCTKYIGIVSQMKRF